MLIKGQKIKKFNTALLIYLLNKGVDFNSQYYEPEYSEAEADLEEVHVDKMEIDNINENKKQRYK